MNDAAIVPYRASALAVIETIDTSLIPDCGREEISRIEKDISASCKAVEAARDAEISKFLKKHVRWPRRGLILAVVVCLGTAAIGAGAAVAALLVGLFLIQIVTFMIAMFKSEDEKNERVKPLLREVHRLETRLQGLRNREKLTNLIAQADRLMLEAETFNQRLSQLGDVACSQREQELILSGRHKIMERILRFREEVEGGPKVSSPAQLMESSDT